MSEEKKPRGRRKKPAVEEIEENFVVELTDTVETPKEKTGMYNPLRDEKIYVRPIRRKDGWLPVNHEANFLFKDAYFEVCATRDLNTGQIINPLDEKEIEFFENIELSHVHGLSYRRGDLAAGRKEGNVWFTHTGVYTMKFRDETKVLDLRNANDYIMYKMLLSNKDLIAPDGHSGIPGNLGHKATFKFKLEKEGFEDQQKAKSADRKKLAYKMYGKLEDDRDAMVTVLSFAFPGQRFPYTTKIDTLKSQLDTLIERRIETFLNIVDDQYFDKKVFLYKAIRNGFVTKETNKVYITGSDDILGRTLADAAKFIGDVANQGLFIELSNKLRATE